MADRLRVMLSSRVDDPKSTLPDGTKMRALRKLLVKEVEALRLTDDTDTVFDVDVNEGTGALAGDGDVDRHCREMVQRADIVLVLYNGRAGWGSQGLEGICHAELRAALDLAPHKVRLIRLPLVQTPTASDLAFQQYLTDHHLVGSDPECGTKDEVAAECRKTLRGAVVAMTRERAREGTPRSARSRGEPLIWARMTLADRAVEMVRSTVDALEQSPRKAAGLAAAGQRARLVELPWGDDLPLLVRVDAVPGAMSLPAARELVGQPFLLDHSLEADLVDRLGPVHLIAVGGGATESQAIRLLGSPDATIVPTDFGVYVADEIQKVQFILLSRCIDRSAIFARVQTLLNWLAASQEGLRLVERARTRAEIVPLLRPRDFSA